MLQTATRQNEVDVNTQHKNESQSSLVKRGKAMVTIDEEGRQTVFATGFKFPAGVDFSEGDKLPNGTFIPRYSGWMKDSGDIYDSYRMLYIRAVNVPAEPVEEYGYVSRWLKNHKR